MHNIVFESRRIAKTYVGVILGFPSREEAEIKTETFEYRKSRIWEMKEDKYTKSLAKNQVYATVHMRDIRKKVLPKFIKLCMETPCLCPFQRHKYGRRKPSQKQLFLSFSTYA